MDYDLGLKENECVFKIHELKDTDNANRRKSYQIRFRPKITNPIPV